MTDEAPPHPASSRSSEADLSPQAGRGEVSASLAHALFSPASVAIVGQSDDATKTAGRPLDYLRQAGFAGRIYPVNPRRQTVLGERAYADARRSAGGAGARLHRVRRRRLRSRRSPNAAGWVSRSRRCSPMAFPKRDRKAKRARRGCVRSWRRPACASSARQASASSTCGTRLSSPPMPPSQKRTCRSGASSPPRIRAA